jgi:hypothetical protein
MTVMLKFYLLFVWFLQMQLAFLLKHRHQNTKPVVIIATSGVQELRSVIKCDNELFIGAHTTLSQLEMIFNELLNSLTGQDVADEKQSILDK